MLVVQRNALGPSWVGEQHTEPVLGIRTESDNKGKVKSERVGYSQELTFISSLTNKQLKVGCHDSPVVTSGCPGLVFPQSASDPVHSEVLLLHHYQRQPCPDRRHRTTAG